MALWWLPSPLLLTTTQPDTQFLGVQMPTVIYVIANAYDDCGYVFFVDIRLARRRVRDLQRKFPMFAPFTIHTYELKQ